MKTTATVLFLAAGLTSFGQPAASGPAGPVSVRIPTEIEELARGYSEAFARITRTPVYLNLRKDGATVTLVSVRAVRPFAGVVVVELDNGFTYILNPEDIVSITDAPPQKAPRP